MKRTNSIKSIALTLTLICGFAHADPERVPHHHGVTADFGVSEATRARVARLTAQHESRPEDSRLLSQLAVELLGVARQTHEHEDFAKAAEAFRELIAINPESVTGHVGLAYALQGRHQFTEAFEHARAASLLEPGAPEITALLSDLHLATGHLAEAELMAQRLADDNLTLESLSRVALVKAERGLTEDATRLMLDAIRAGELLDAPKASIAWCHEMLATWALESGRFADARREADLAALLTPSSPHAQFLRSQIDMKEGDASGAVTILEHLVAHYPNPRHWIALAEALEARGHEGDAEKAHELEHIAEADMLGDLDMGDVGHIRELVEFWLAQHENEGSADRFERAAELAMRDLRETRQDGATYETAAWALHKAGRTSEALPMARTAVLLAPGSARANWRAGMICEASGSRLEAKRYLRAALIRNPALDEPMRREAERVMSMTIGMNDLDQRDPR